MQICTEVDQKKRKRKIYQNFFGLVDLWSNCWGLCSSADLFHGPEDQLRCLWRGRAGQPWDGAGKDDILEPFHGPEDQLQSLLRGRAGQPWDGPGKDDVFEPFHWPEDQLRCLWRSRAGQPWDGPGKDDILESFHWTRRSTTEPMEVQSQPVMRWSR